MATNTIAGVNLTRIAQLSLDALVANRFQLPKIVTDISTEVQPTGNAVTTRFPTQVATQDFDSSKATSNAAMTARTVTLNQFRGVSIGFKDTERTFSDINLSTMYIEPTLSAIFEDIFDNVAARVTAANFSTNVVSNSASFDADDVADLATTLSTAKVPLRDRSIVLSPAYFGSLVKDSNIQSAYAYGGSETIRENSIPRLHGFDLIEFTGSIPTNSENLVGWACAPQAMVLAARAVVPPPVGTWSGNVADIVDPVSGMPIQIREWYDGVELRYEWATLYGTQIGVTGNLVRILSA